MGSNLYFMIVGGLFMFLVIKLLVRVPGILLAKKFKSIGSMKGLSKQELVKKVGNFQSIKYIDGGSVCIWKSAGYMISIVFDTNDNFLKVNSETLVK